MAVKRKAPLGLLEQIDRHITNPLKLDSRAKHFYPTQASCYDKAGKLHGACLRSVMLGYWGIPKSNPPKADTMYTFGVGKHIELMMLEWFKEMGIYKGHNIKFFNPDFHLSGELDMVVSDQPGSDNLYGVECKTSYGDYFKTEVITGRAGKPPAPKEDHVTQVMLYLDAFPTLPYFRLVYIGRDRFDRTEYAIRLVEINGDKYPEITSPSGQVNVNTDLSLGNIYNRYMDAKNADASGTLPAADYTPLMTQADVDRELAAGNITKNKAATFKKGESLTTDWRCTYCDHRNTCRGLPEVAVKNFRERYGRGEFKEYDPSLKKKVGNTLETLV